MSSIVEEILPDVLPEDRFLWQFWVNKGMVSEPLTRALGALGSHTNWDYIAGNALYGGFEDEVLRVLKREGSPAPPAFVERLARDVAGSGKFVAPGTPECDLLVLCASPRMTGDEEQQAARLAGKPLDWEALVAAAGRANLTVAVQHNLARLALDLKMPRAGADLLAARARGIRARNLRLMGMIDDLIRRLTKEGIRVLFLKESGLALSHYGNGRFRMMGDIDLLLSPDEIERVVAMLEEAGYQSAEVLWTKEHFRLRHHHAAPLVHSDLAVKIEPHRTIALYVLSGAEPTGMIDEMAAASVRVDARSWCFTPADTLFHLCMDLWGSAFIGKMGQLCDAREVVRQGGVEWGLLEQRAQSCNAEAHLAFSLRLLARYQVRVPPDLLVRLAGARRPSFDARRLRKMADRNLFGFVRSRARLSRAGEKLLFHALCRPGGWPARAAFLMKRYLYLGEGEDGMGELSLRSRPTTRRALSRMLTLPMRVVKRWTGSRRIP